MSQWSAFEAEQVREKMLTIGTERRDGKLDFAAHVIGECGIYTDAGELRVCRECSVLTDSAERWRVKAEAVARSERQRLSAEAAPTPMRTRKQRGTVKPARKVCEYRHDWDYRTQFCRQCGEENPSFIEDREQRERLEAEFADRKLVRAEATARQRWKMADVPAFMDWYGEGYARLYLDRCGDPLLFVDQGDPWQEADWMRTRFRHHFNHDGRR